ncbi:MAG: hypothetical protein OHK0039_10390 [Bacteroidia bacterium]
MKPTTLALLLLLSGWQAAAQTGINLQWARALTNTAGASSMVWNAVLPQDGGLIVAGQASLPSGLGMYIGRYQPGGQLQWDSTLLTSGRSAFGWLAADAQGSLYAVGAEVLGAFDERQIHLVKCSPAGQIVWRKTYRGPDDQFAAASDVVLADGHLYLCGQYLTATGDEVSFVARFDLDGDLDWQQAFQPGVPTFLSRLAVDAAGTVTAVGSADDAFSFLVVQYSSAGVLSWQYPAPSPVASPNTWPMWSPMPTAMSMPSAPAKAASSSPRSSP